MSIPSNRLILATIPNHADRVVARNWLATEKTAPIATPVKSSVFAKAAKVAAIAFILGSAFGIGTLFAADNSTNPEVLGYVRVRAEPVMSLVSVNARGDLFVMDHGMSLDDCSAAMIADIENHSLQCWIESTIPRR